MLPVLFLMFIYAVAHSYLAGARARSAFRARFGERAYHGLYRAIFNIVALATLAPILGLIMLAPGPNVWILDFKWLFIIQAVGLVGFIVALLQVDFLRFAGLKQLFAYLNGAPLPLPDEAMQTGGLYRLVRHPLYLFSLLVLWPVSAMTAAYLGFCIGATLYFVIGSWYEERRLVALFGPAYVDYQRRVPWLFPLSLRAWRSSRTEER